MRITLRLMVIALAAFVLPQLVLAAPTEQRCEPSAAVISGADAVYESAPGEVVRHTWKLENDGRCDWPRGTQLVFAGGERFSGPQSYELDSLAPGQTTNVVVDLQTPTSAGEYSGVWQVRSGDAAISGRLVVGFIVAPPVIAEPNNPTRDDSGQDDLPFGIDSPQTHGGLPTPFIDLQASDNVQVPAGGIGNVTIACEEGVVVGGGWYIYEDFEGSHNYNNSATVYESRQVGNGWRLSFRNPSDTDILAYGAAYCLHNVGGTTFDIIYPVPLNPLSSNEGLAHCPEGSLMVGGGFNVFPYDELELRRNDSSPDTNSWKIKVFNRSAFSTSATVSATCYIGGTASISRVASGWNSIDPQEGDWEYVFCPEDSLMTNGGFGQTGFLYQQSLNFDEVASAPDYWQVAAYNPFGSTHSLYASAVCVSFP
ncbi:MAG: hypothetical protein DWQ07_06355 [Chloroflexi bacterium]|nr:MAG: hypothetical protein DWQ07_06355 [Chloroflexota bacterium]MBL1195949.1 hypothetical protein [Chloroflexota bacterium]NOH13243.1 hypothetical protein [Chloroflexota bacterium]